MSIKDQINADLKQAIKNLDNAKRDALRGLTAAIRQVEVDKQKDLSDDEIIAILQKEAKNRNETIDAFTQGGRPEDAEQERIELAIIEDYLPEPLSEEELEALVDDAIAKTGASSPQDTGKVMGMVMGKVKGRADGKVISQMVREKLS
jgi:uncharacterized protein YqeY